MPNPSKGLAELKDIAKSLATVGAIGAVATQGNEAQAMPIYKAIPKKLPEEKIVEKAIEYLLKREAKANVLMTAAEKARSDLSIIGSAVKEYHLTSDELKSIDELLRGDARITAENQIPGFGQYTKDQERLSDLNRFAIGRLPRNDTPAINSKDIVPGQRVWVKGGYGHGFRDDHGIVTDVIPMTGPTKSDSIVVIDNFDNPENKRFTFRLSRQDELKLIREPYFNGPIQKTSPSGTSHLDAIKLEPEIAQLNAKIEAEKPQMEAAYKDYRNRVEELVKKKEDLVNLAYDKRDEFKILANREFDKLQNKANQAITGSSDAQSQKIAEMRQIKTDYENILNKPYTYRQDKGNNVDELIKASNNGQYVVEMLREGMVKERKAGVLPSGKALIPMGREGEPGARLLSESYQPSYRYGRSDQPPAIALYNPNKFSYIEDSLNKEGPQLKINPDGTIEQVKGSQYQTGYAWKANPNEKVFPEYVLTGEDAAKFIEQKDPQWAMKNLPTEAQRASLSKLKGKGTVAGAIGLGGLAASNDALAADLQNPVSSGMGEVGSQLSQGLEFVDRFVGNPYRAALNSALQGKGLLSSIQTGGEAYSHAINAGFGAMPESAKVSGEQVANSFFNRTPQLGFPNPATGQREYPLAGALGVAIDIGVDPTNLVFGMGGAKAMEHAPEYLNALTSDILKRGITIP